jgi:hypothetical protein
MEPSGPLGGGKSGYQSCMANLELNWATAEVKDSEDARMTESFRAFAQDGAES